MPEQTDIFEAALRQLKKTGRNYFVLNDEDTMEIFVPKADLRQVEAEDAQ